MERGTRCFQWPKRGAAEAYGHVRKQWRRKDDASPEHGVCRSLLWLHSHHPHGPTFEDLFLCINPAEIISEIRFEYCVNALLA
jgi:hypothetical protein